MRDLYRGCLAAEDVAYPRLERGNMQASESWPAVLETLYSHSHRVEDLTDVGYPKLGMLRNATMTIAAGWRRFAQTANKQAPDQQLQGDRGAILRGEVTRATKLLSGLHEIAVSDDFEQVAATVKELVTSAQIAVANLPETVDTRSGLDLRSASDQVRKSWRQVELELERERSASDSIAHLRSMVEEAQKASGVVAQGALSEAFDALSTEERKAAGRFRVATFALVSVSVLVLTVPPLFDLISEIDLSRGEPTVELISRLAVSAAVGGAAAYSARQAGHHRRVHVWAKSIATQLRSLNSFIAPISEDSVRNVVIEATARRMLSEPPHSGKQEPQADTTSLLQLAVDLARRPPA